MKNKKFLHGLLAAVVFSVCTVSGIWAQETDFADGIQVSVEDVEEAAAEQETENNLEAAEIETEEIDVEIQTELENLPADETIGQLPVSDDIAFVDIQGETLFSSGEELEEEVLDAAGTIVSVNFNSTNFPDEALRKVLQKYDTNVDSVFSVEEIAVVTSLNLSGKEIASLKGLQYFKNLTELNCSNNKLESLDLTGYDNLVTLNCSGNKITSLNVSGLKKLETLNCQSNGMITLTVNGAERLTTLSCGLNKLTKLDVSALKNLEWLACGANSLTTLNVSGLTSLTELYCTQNNLTSLDVSTLTKLEKLYCSLLPVKSLDLSGLMNLRVLAVGGTDEDVFLQELKLDKTINIEEFRIWNANLTSLDLSSMPKLTTLVIDGSTVSITALSLSERAVLSTFTANIAPMEGIYKTLTQCSAGWQLDLKALLNGKDSSRMTVTSVTLEGGESLAVDNVAVDGEYLIFKTSEKPKQMHYTWDTGSADGRKMDVDLYLNVESIKLASVTLKEPEVVFERNTKSDRIRLNWETVAGASGYYIYQYNTSTGKWSKIASTLGRYQDYYIISDAEIGNTYTYSVGAFSYLDQRDKTKVTAGTYDKTGVTIMQKFYDYPLAITSGSCISYAKNHLVWEARPKAQGFIVYRRVPGGRWSRIAMVNSSVTAYDDTTCAAGTYYEYAVKAYAATSAGKTYLTQYETEVGIHTIPQSAALTGVQVVENDSVKITWKAAAGADKYGVFRKEPGGSWKRIAYCSSNELSYTDTTTTLGASYAYTVRSYAEDAGFAVWGNYNTKGLSITQTYDSNVITITSVAALDDTSVRVAWEEREGSTGYRIFRKKQGDKKWTLLANVKNKLEYTDQTCESGTNYYYTVRAYATYNGSTIHSKYHSGVKVTMPLGTPEFNKVYVTSKDIIRVMWDEIEEANGYLVFRREVGGSWSRVATIQKQQCYYTDTKAVMGKTYQYRVRAYTLKNGVYVYSGFSKISSQIKQTFFNSQVSMTAKKASATSAKITWTKRSRAQRYLIYRKEAGGSWGRIANVNANTFAYTDTTCKKGKTYQYLVRAYAGGVSTKVWNGVTVKF